ncbi:dUTP diphosphatase [Niallia sp. RD1]|uniref:dUTP diphosphatase n=1 Tax=Niallia sp. RD1 TaxID=2962858 RepID=UPI0020C190F3|nr:dUTP diphosphatase [Niallia sp. RD1]UTI41102.1 dUTP diphosphatase [Niallia sp. RD1]
MNLAKLFETQRVLRDRIGYNEPDRFEKLILALLVEIGECANEFRGFKFWSKDQEPRVTTKCNNCSGEGVGFFSGNEYTGNKQVCVVCDGTGKDKNKNPLLEEYVDGLHFVLEIGLEINDIEFRPIRLISLTNNITQQFKSIFKIASELDLSMLLIDSRKYQTLFNNYLLLGEMLGFTWEEVEAAYYAKNKINHVRQDTGY